MKDQLASGSGAERTDDCFGASVYCGDFMRLIKDYEV